MKLIQRKYISIVISAYNEEANITRLYDKLLLILSSIENIQYELIFVNDGSLDETKAKVLELMNIDNNVRLVDLVRNFGHEIAMTAGMDYCMGDCVIYGC
ncbi:MAG: glycosyltransferase [Chloroflexia bacterium]|nr:glycosyltransferase [Chloroflexia bacterium]